jgi:hypothetical protein
MSRIPLGYYLIVGLLFWGLPAAVFVGPRAIEYSIAAVVPIWLLCRGISSPPNDAPARWVSIRTCVVLAAFSALYFAWDAVLGRQLLQVNMFLFGKSGEDQLIQGYNASVGQSGGIADLLGYILVLLPLALIDSARTTSRYGRLTLWAIALLGLFYETGSGRGFVLMAVMAIVFGRNATGRRILAGTGLALGAFVLASKLRAGGTDLGGNPILTGTIAPFINLGLMVNAHCGTAPWYSFVLEFLKKFMPGFLIPKTIFSFNMEMSFCIYPSVNNTVESVSIFTWLGEIFYYTPSLLTAVSAGALLGSLTRLVDKRLVRNQMYSARLFAGLLCILMPRSRSLDVLTFLIAQLIFLFFFWPCLLNLLRFLHRFLVAPVGSRSASVPGTETS